MLTVKLPNRKKIAKHKLNHKIQMKKIILTFLALLSVISINAQRFTDRLDRGLVAVVPKSGSGIFLSWRIQADEYYDVTYNLYKNGTKIASNLNVSNYMDTSGKTTDKYTVTAVVMGVEKEASKEAVVFGTAPYTERGYAGAPAYLSIQMQDVFNRDGERVFCSCGQHTIADNVKQEYTINDVSLADLDGDGEIELIVKRLNATDASYDFELESENPYKVKVNKEINPANSNAFVIIEAYKLNGTRLWWIDCGPNMVSLNSTELNCVAYDWDQDGKAEVIMRGADNMIIHKSDGNVQNVGDMDVNSRFSDMVKTYEYKKDSKGNLSKDSKGNYIQIDPSQYAWTKTGAEYLLYLNGETADPYSITDFPLKRYESGETDLETAWGDNYGHRSNKFFFGAPFLDGRKASIFLARGIYTRHKMIALDVDKDSHALTTRWTWNSNTPGDWYGQGNHNMTIADVDGDGCDEIVYGSMVIDNNGQGLSTTGLGHGDALHVGDLDPFRKGMEVFACNEDMPSNNYRDATTSEILFRTGPTYNSKGEVIDDGRCMAGNFSNQYPGGIAASTCSSGVISLTTQKEIDGLANQCFTKPWNPMTLDFRIYWDGDLCEESMDSPGTAKDCVVIKEGERIMQTSGVNLINDSKNNPCAQGDILGDWREELVLRSSDDKELRIYSTTDPTEYRIPSLWYDHQYRQAMVWQVCAYNQPPHASFFLGELEGITKAPVPLTNEGREEITTGSTISTECNGKKMMFVVPTTGNANFSFTGKISPAELIVNVPTLVSGNNNNDNITYTQRSCTIGYSESSSGIEGSTHFVKQGEGLLVMPKKTLSYTGDTEVWGGTMRLNGTTLSESNVWMNRHTILMTNGTIKKGLTMEYGSTLAVTATGAMSGEASATAIGTLTLKEGARVKLDLTKSGNDVINLTNLVIETKDWQYGPKYLSPVFEFVTDGKIPDSNPRVKIGTITGSLTGSLDNIVIEGIEMQNDKDIYYLEQDGTDLYIAFKSIDSDITKPVKLSDEEWKLNFENTSSNNYGFTSIRINEQAEGGNMHCLHLGVSSESGARSSNREFTEDDFRTTGDYTFEFDFAAASGNNNTDGSTISVLGTNATLFTIKYNNYASTASIYDNSNNVIGTININAYTKNSTNLDTYIPTVWSHFKVTANSSGLTLTVTQNGNTVVDNATISSEYDGIKALNTTIARGYGHVCYDDIILTKAGALKMTLADSKYPVYDAGVYKVVEMDRTLVQGYNTLCLPFDTNVETVAGTGAKAYTLTNGTLSNNTLYFPEVTDGHLLANRPYVIWCPSSHTVPDMGETTLAVAKPMAAEGAGWKMVGNYIPHFSTEGNYVIYGDELRKCGSTAYVNGMRAYFIAPSIPSSAKVRVRFGTDDDIESSIDKNSTSHSEVLAIYGVDGKKRSALQHGINIIRMKDGSVRKEYVK